MNTVDKITKESKLLIDSAKDTLTTNLVAAMKSGTLDLREDQVSRLVTLINASLDQGYQKAIPVFQSSIKKYQT